MKIQRTLTPGISVGGSRRHNRSLRWAILAAAPVACCLTSSAIAQLQWDASGTATSPAAATDGGGFWDASNSLSNPDSNWFNGSADGPWVGGDSATFGNVGNNPSSGAAGTVTIDDASGGVSVSSLTFNPAGSGDYTIAAIPGDSLTLTGTPVITLSGAVNPTISAPIAGSSGVVVAGSGNTVTFAGANTYTGTTVIQSTGGGVPSGVTLVLPTGASLGSAADTIDVGSNKNATSGANVDTSALIMTGTSVLTAAILNVNVIGQGISVGTSAGNTMTVSGNNVINADTITIDSGVHGSNTKGGDGALVLGSGATLTLHGSAGSGAVTLLDIADYSYETGGSTGTGAVGVVDFSQGTVNGTIGTVNVGTGKAGTDTNHTDDVVADGAFGTLLFANGNLNITALNIADLGSESCSGTVTLEAGGTGTLTVGALNFANNGTKVPTVNTTYTGIVNVNGGLLDVQGPMVNVNPTGSANTLVATTIATVNVGGGTLNMNGNAIGSATAPVTLSATAGNLENIGLVNGTGGVTMSGTGTLFLSGTNTYTGGTNVSSGTLVASTPGALPAGAVNITGGTLQLAVSTGAATLTSLAISGNGTLDMTNNHVFIDYGSGPDPIASIAALLAAGYNSGSWTGVNGIDTSSPLVVGGLTYGLGYADGADPQSMATGLASGTIEIKYTLLGDADLNGIVNGIDFGILAANFNKGITGWDEGDFDYNNIVNGLDFGDLAANFNKGAAGTDAVAALDAFAAANGLLADVPEPASLGLLLLGASATLARRRKRIIAG